MFDISRFLIGYFLWFFVNGLALWRGGRPERTVAVINVIGILLTPVVQDRALRSEFQPSLTLVNLAVLIGFMAVALRSDRWWPLFAAAAALMTVLTNVAYLTIHMPLRLAQTGWIIWSYVALLSLAGGLAEVELRRRRGYPI